MTSGFGPRNGTMHRGIDFASVKPGKDYSGAPILAAEDGVVVEARSGVSGFGCWIILEHRIDDELLHTVHGHLYLKDLLVKAGQQVTRGQQIGRVGNNGDSSGAHLHFEVWRNGRYKGTAIDPAPWLGLT